MPHSPAALDHDRSVVSDRIDHAMRTCGIIKDLLEMSEYDRAKVEFNSLVNEVGAAGVALHGLLGNRALFARSDLLEARVNLTKMQEPANA